MDELQISRDLTPEQFGAIKRSIELGRILQEEHPEIAESYRNGCFVREIVEELDICNKYNVTQRVAENGILRALTGCEGYSGVEGYEGFLSTEEREQLAKEHRIECSKSVGLRNFEEGIGLAGMTQEQRYAAAKKAGSASYKSGKGATGLSKGKLSEAGKRGGAKGGKISGRKMFEEGRGIFAMSEEEKRRAYKNSAMAKEVTSWSDEEKREAYELSLLPEYRHGSLTNNVKIADYLNEKHHSGNRIRTRGAVSRMIAVYKKSLEKRVDGENQ